MVSNSVANGVGAGPSDRDVLHQRTPTVGRRCDCQRLARPGHGLDERHVPADDPRGAKAGAAVRRRIGQDRRLRAVTVHNDVDPVAAQPHERPAQRVRVGGDRQRRGDVARRRPAREPAEVGRRTGLGAVPRQIGGSRVVDRDAGRAPRPERERGSVCGSGCREERGEHRDGERSAQAPTFPEARLGSNSRQTSVTSARERRPSQRGPPSGNPSYIRTPDSSPERMSSTTAAMSRSIRRSASRNATRARIIACASRAFGLACSIPRSSRACASAIR